jgi:hypothetical protein
MRGLSLVAAVPLLFVVASIADAQNATRAAASCNLPHASGVQQLQIKLGRPAPCAPPRLPSL